MKGGYLNMNAYEIDDVVEPFGDDDDVIRLSPLEELSQDLLSESIKYQIQNPFSSKTNLLQEFIDEYDETAEWLDGNDEATYTNNNIAMNFYVSVIKMIDEKFKLDIDYTTIESLNVDGLRNLTEGLYTFFIIKYEKNVAKYLTGLILDFKDTIIDNLDKDGLDTDSVSYVSYKRKLTNPKDVYIFTEINNVIQQIRTIELSVDDFIEYFNEEKFEVAIVKYAVDNFIITGEFVKDFLEPVFGYDVQNDDFDRIISDVLQNLFKKLKLDEIPSIKDLEDMAEKDD
jgi:hypothetical protein